MWRPTLPKARYLQRCSGIQGRALATSTSRVTEWLVIFPDNPGVLDRRLKIRPKHSPNFVRLHNEGYVSWAGPVFHEHVSDGQKRPFKGSVMVVNDVEPSAILEKLKSDPYIQEKIWDLDKTEFIPFQTLVRSGK